MKYISSDTNVWLDFEIIHHLELPFKLPYTYLMNKDAVHDELLSPPKLGDNLLMLGLIETELTEEEFYQTEEYMEKFRKPSIYDCAALAIAKCRKLVLMTGDGPLRKAAQEEGVKVIGTIGVLDQLYSGRYISRDTYLECLKSLRHYNGGRVRLPKKELEIRIKQFEN